MKRIPSAHTIVLDAGHGGTDSGMVNKALKLEEKDLTLDTVLRLKKILEHDGFKVLLTRDDDRSIDKVDRHEVTNKADADLFVSIHFNSVEQGVDQVTGIEVFSYTPRHQLSTDQTPDPQYMNVPQPGNEHDHWSAVLSRSVHKALLKDLAVPDRGLKHARYAVLRLAPCPAILVESGYLSNNAEAKKLATPQYRQRIAEAIADGIGNYSIALDAARRLKR